MGSLKKVALQISLLHQNFDKETIVYENCRDQNMLLMITCKDIRGEYELTFDSKTYK
jgi:hypothetical protein